MCSVFYVQTYLSACVVHVQEEGLTEEQQKVLAIMEKTFSCYITEDPKAKVRPSSKSEAPAIIRARALAIIRAKKLGTIIAKTLAIIRARAPAVLEGLQQCLTDNLMVKLHPRCRS